MTNLDKADIVLGLRLTGQVLKCQYLIDDTLLHKCSHTILDLGKYYISQRWYPQINILPGLVVCFIDTACTIMHHWYRLILNQYNDKIIDATLLFCYDIPVSILCKHFFFGVCKNQLSYRYSIIIATMFITTQSEILLNHQTAIPPLRNKLSKWCYFLAMIFTFSMQVARHVCSSLPHNYPKSTSPP